MGGRRTESLRDPEGLSDISPDTKIKIFKHYLLDNPFTVISDHRPLQWLVNYKDEIGRLGRWAILLAGMKYKIKYIPGRVHQNADCLSRLPIASITELTNESVSLAAKQKEDTLCTDIIEYLNNGEIEDKYKHNMPVWDKEIELYFMRNGKLYRELAGESTKRRPSPRAQIVLPLSLRHATLNEFHDQPTAGHLAFQRTYLRVQD